MWRSAKLKKRSVPRTKRATYFGKRDRRGDLCGKEPFVPPEDWHEPQPIVQRQPGRAIDYRVIDQPPGKGFRHVVTPEEVRQRLGLLPQEFITALEVVQLSRMTRKKRAYPCYGMQWGKAVYLYPLENELVEHFDRPPTPAQYNEAVMYGGRWLQEGAGWRLKWCERTIKDFYLNNVLIHELGHLLDHRNTRPIDRERFAEWFAIEHGYRASQRPTSQSGKLRRRKRPVRRHHR